MNGMPEDGVGKGVEGEGASEQKGSNNIGRSDEGVGGRVGIIMSSKVAVVRDIRKESCKQW